MVISQKANTRDQVREALLDAMDRLLVRFGYQKTTVDDLAAEAGIGKGTVYLYFNSKEQVALSCIDRLHERLLTKIACIAQGNWPAQEKISKILLERVMSRFEYCRNATCLDEMLAALQKELLARKEIYHAKEASLLEQLLLEAAAAGELPRCDARAAAEAMILATNALLPYSLKTTQLGSSDAVEEKVRRVASLLVLGLSGLPPSQTNINLHAS
jgi:TetR/AcrR family fatty acid metabolism transcriptional regulator